MSSTSSSDCENCDCCQCAFSLDDNHNSYTCQYGKSSKTSRHVPMYTTMAHPLIYYAEVPRPQNRRQIKEQPRKENRNCFVKAFKWYTQEREPYGKCDVCPERNGFANWLDNKYIEYLQDSRQLRPCELKPQPTTTIEPCPLPCASPFEPCTTRKFARIRSPWRKRRRPCNDSGDVPEKGANQSCEFILQPKDLTRAASDNCYHSPTSGCIKSNTTSLTSNTPCNLRCSGRSHSLSSVCRERSIPKYIDTIPDTVQEGPKLQECPRIQECSKIQESPLKPQESPKSPCCVCHQEQILQVPSKSRAVDVWCQCPEEKVIPVNVETQYEPLKSEPSSCIDMLYAPCLCTNDTEYSPKPVKPLSKKTSKTIIAPKKASSVQSHRLKKQKKMKQSNVSCQCPEENIVTVETPSQCRPEPCACCRNVCAPDGDVKEVSQVFGPKPIRRQSYSTVAVNEISCECTVKDVAIVSKVTRSLTCVANDAVQTSDHAICFEKCGPCPHPLFLKILCTDRTNKECF